MLPELLNDVPVPDHGITYAILLAEPQRDTAAGAAIAYGIKVILTLDDRMDKASPVAIR